MNGELSPEDQLKVLGKIWGVNRDGYVFLPHIDGNARSSQARRSSYHENRAFAWPKQKGDILEHLRQHTEDDLYFTPNIFNAKKRIEQNVDNERVLYADLDPVDPHTLGDLRPTIAWESSPGRYQAVWLLNTEKVGATWPSNENHKLTLAIGADPSGWDSTQLLRVPGRRNHKPEHPEQGAPGKLLWDNGPRYVWSDFEDLPEVGSVVGEEDIELVDDELLDGVDRHEIWSTVRLKVRPQIREYLATRDIPEGVDRSEVLWQIERELADAGCSLVEIIALIRPSVWNKYAGRNDELKRLKIEAAKAIAARPDTLEHDQEWVAEKPNAPQWLNEVMAKPIPRPRWLVHDVWTRGGCGFIAGAPKSYKSWLGLDLALSVATGADWLGFRVVKSGPVLYLQEEDDISLVASRMSNILDAKAPELHWHGRLEAAETAGDDVPLSTPRAGGARRQKPARNAARRVFWSPPARDIPLAMHVQTGFIASDPSWQAWLSDMCSKEEFVLVVIDTLGTTAGDIDTDKAGELMTKLLGPLKVIAKSTDTAMCVIHHNKKTPTQNGRAGNDMLGSVALHAWVDCALYARTKNGQEIVLEREAKAATEWVHRVKVPTMFVRGDERQLWAPIVDDVPVETKQPRKRVPGRIKIRLTNMGKRPTLDKARMSFDETELKQLLELIRDGVITEDDDGVLVF